MVDPDTGRWTYSRNALGELVSQTDARGRTATMTYDRLGRMTRRVEPEGTTTWSWDGAARRIGKLTNRVGRSLRLQLFAECSNCSIDWQACGAIAENDWIRRAGCAVRILRKGHAGPAGVNS